MEKTKQLIWIETEKGIIYFDDIEEARWYVTRYLKGLAEIHSDNH